MTPNGNYYTGYRAECGKDLYILHSCYTEKKCCEGGRDEDSPATIYLIWLSWLHSRRPELLDAEAGTGRGRDAGKLGPQCATASPLFPCIS